LSPRPSGPEKSATADAALEGGERLLECAAHAGQVPVVDETAVELAAQLAQDVDPVGMPGPRRDGLGRWGDDDPLDDLDRGATRGGRATLLPRPVPAGRRAPLGYRAAGARRDRATAPPACRRRLPSPPCAWSALDRCGRRWWLLLDGRSLRLLATPAFALPLARAVLTAALAGHATSVRGDVQELVTTNCLRLDAPGVWAADRVVLQSRGVPLVEEESSGVARWFIGCWGAPAPETALARRRNVVQEISSCPPVPPTGVHRFAPATEQSGAGRAALGPGE
jgi:hypothetical protein